MRFRLYTHTTLTMLVPLLFRRLLTISTSPPPSASLHMTMTTKAISNSIDTMMAPTDVLHFWFEELTPKDWFNPSNPVELDAKIRDKFEHLLEKASACELSSWRSTPDGSLAEIIVLDQFSRNIYRNTPKAFAQDPLALGLAQEAIGKGFDKVMEPSKLSFLYMPFMHSESRLIHERAMELFDTPGLEMQFDFEKKHKAIIDRFGQYPHRNEILGRLSTEEEDAFLKQPGSSF